jgi:hypothetical protein
MISNNFSLTQEYIINPVLQVSANPSVFVSREIGARVFAAFTSVFAAVDCFIHLTAGLCAGGYSILQTALPVPTLSISSHAADDHISSAWFFAKLAVGGSIAGLINPKALAHLEKTPTLLAANDIDNPIIQSFISELLSSKGNKTLSNIREFWEQASLQDKHSLVQAIRENIPSTHPIYKELSSLFFRSTDLDKEAQWIPPSPNPSSLEQSFYYYAASKDSLLSIIEAEKIPVRHEKIHTGAPVLTAPNYGLGLYALALRPNIERLSAPYYTFKVSDEVQCTGFSRAIPVNVHSLACIIFHESVKDSAEEIKKQLLDLTGREIEMIPAPSSHNEISLMRKHNQGIPSEWTNIDSEIAEEILDDIIKNPVKMSSLQEELRAPFIDGYMFIAKKTNDFFSFFFSPSCPRKKTLAYKPNQVK